MFVRVAIVHDRRYVADSRRVSLLGDFHAAPERHMMLHIARRRLRVRIVPRRIRVLLAIDHDRVIPCLPLPWAAGGG